IGDHQNKPDVASAIARRWFDVDGVSAVAELTNSAVALAVQQIAKEKGKITLFTGPATTRLTNEDCSPTGFHWAFDTYSQAVGTARAVVAEGGKSWFLLVADYAFGHQMANHQQGRQDERRHRGRPSPPSAQHERLLIISVTGAELESSNYRPGERRCRYHQLGETGGRIPYRRGRPEAGWSRGCDQRYRRAGPDDGQRAGLHDGFLLGSGRGISGLVEALL